MWAVLSLLCAGAGLLGPPACGAADLYVSSLEKVHFKSWMVQHQKRYSSEEYQRRLQTFVGNWRRISTHNAGNHTFKMGLNQFSDMSFAEIKHKYLWSEPQNCSATRGNYLRGTGPYPPFVDWRTKGKYVSPVKNQGGCGSCWTFSTTGALESAIAIKTGKLLSLAEQQLVDCAQNFNNHGCQGGLPSQAFEYIRYNKGIMGEDTYPYKGQEERSPADRPSEGKEGHRGAEVSGERPVSQIKKGRNRAIQAKPPPSAGWRVQPPPLSGFLAQRSLLFLPRVPTQPPASVPTLGRRSTF
ncbi:pro-cathepsin H isoform X3 [Prionailurus bengalensis]|uniref:pro-cathepsin H isoform X3 n=1 Tax=Prionailurus bengalensis TaxID=37029 RepID=UPI001CA9AEA6|nr:pro-cathepsin H isoform X3 [Prionailurus bengalensis]